MQGCDFKALKAVESAKDLKAGGCAHSKCKANVTSVHVRHRSHCQVNQPLADIWQKNVLTGHEKSQDCRNAILVGNCWRMSTGDWAHKQLGVKMSNFCWKRATCSQRTENDAFAELEGNTHCLVDRLAQNKHRHLLRPSRPYLRLKNPIYLLKMTLTVVYSGFVGCTLRQNGRRGGRSVSMFMPRKGAIKMISLVVAGHMTLK